MKEQAKINNKIWEKKIREATEIYVADLFRISVNDLRREFIFGVDLKPIRPPSLKEDVYEELRLDFLFVADDNTRKLFNSGKIKVNTVEELCNHMVRCYKFNKTRVCSVLNLKVGKRRKKLCFLRKFLCKGKKRTIFNFIRVCYELI